MKCTAFPFLIVDVIQSMPPGNKPGAANIFPLRKNLWRDPRILAGQLNQSNIF